MLKTGNTENKRIYTPAKDILIGVFVHMYILLTLNLISVFKKYLKLPGISENIFVLEIGGCYIK